jgi:putative endonuclease
MFYYTYVLWSTKDNKLYIGYSDNLRKRLIEHKNGKVLSTRSRKPLKLVYYEACLDKNLALKRERYFKTGFGRRYLKERLNFKQLLGII